MNQIWSVSEELLEQKIVEKVLRSLPPKFDHTIVSIKESKDLSNYSLVKLMDSLESYEARFKRTIETIVEQVFQRMVDVQNKYESSWRSGRSGKKERWCEHSNRGRGHGKSNNHERAIYSHYGKSNHKRKDC